MRLETYYRILKHDPDGKLVKDTGLIASQSYVIQFLELIEAFFGKKSKNATDVAPAESVLIDKNDVISTKGRVNAAAGDDTYGIVVGTGDTAVDNEDYALAAKIAEGVASGELSYQGVTFVAPAVDAPNVDFDITRTFLNEHATDSVTVKEIGIICKNTTDTKYHLLLRDVLAVEEEEEVTAGFTLTVVYTLRTTV